MNNVGLAAHRLARPARPRLPERAPCPGSSMLAAGPDASSYPDNGSVYTSRFTGGRKAFEYVLPLLGIRQKNGSPGHPPTQGKTERFPQTPPPWLRSRPPPPAPPQLQGPPDEFPEPQNKGRPPPA